MSAAEDHSEDVLHAFNSNLQQAFSLVNGMSAEQKQQALQSIQAIMSQGDLSSDKPSVAGTTETTNIKVSKVVPQKYVAKLVEASDGEVKIPRKRGRPCTKYKLLQKTSPQSSSHSSAGGAAAPDTTQSVSIGSSPTPPVAPVSAATESPAGTRPQRASALRFKEKMAEMVKIKIEPDVVTDSGDVDYVQPIVIKPATTPARRGRGRPKKCSIVDESSAEDEPCVESKQLSLSIEPFEPLETSRSDVDESNVEDPSPQETAENSTIDLTNILPMKNEHAEISSLEIQLEDHTYRRSGTETEHNATRTSKLKVIGFGDDQDVVVKAELDFSRPQPIREDGKITGFGCPLCDHLSKSKAAMIAHIRIHTKERPYSCEYCTSAFHTISNLKRHIRERHMGIKPYSCETCSREFYHKKKLQEHSVQEHGVEIASLLVDKRRKVDVDEAYVPPPKKIVKEPEVVVGSFLCDYCGKTFKTEKAVTEHAVVHLGLQPFQCKLCGRCFSFRSNLHRHTKLHLDQKPHQCKHCGRGFVEIKCLKVHLARKHQEDPNQLLVKYPCTACDRAFSSSSSLNAHMLAHTGKKAFMCDQCPQKFHQHWQLQRHLRVHTGEKPHVCVHCGRSFAEKCALSRHELIHTGQKPHRCEVCGKRFRQLASLFSHRPSHHGERSFECPDCGRTFLRRSHFNFHVKTHREPRQHHCTVCTSAFHRKCDLKRHMLRHQEEKPHACPQCPKRFTRPQYLTEHMNQHAGTRPYRCRHCQACFPDLSSCYKHMRTHTHTTPGSNANFQILSSSEAVAAGLGDNCSFLIPPAPDATQTGGEMKPTLLEGSPLEHQSLNFQLLPQSAQQEMTELSSLGHDLANGGAYQEMDQDNVMLMTKQEIDNEDSCQVDTVLEGNIVSIPENSGAGGERNMNVITLDSQIVETEVALKTESHLTQTDAVQDVISADNIEVLELQEGSDLLSLAQAGGNQGDTQFIIEGASGNQPLTTLDLSQLQLPVSDGDGKPQQYYIILNQ